MTKFKVGDKVAVRQGCWVYGTHEGKNLIIHTVYAAHTHPEFPYAVRVEGEAYQSSHDYRDSELELREEPEAKAEAVEHPAHYGGDTPYEVIKVAEAWGFEKNAYLFNALKYLGRCEHKGRKVEDLKKLVYYVEREIALEDAK